MVSRAHRPASPRWPFWLLMAAWFCANSPQSLTFEFVVWFGNARHFSHQQRLTSEVASVLAGEHVVHALAVATEAPTQPFTPTVPADATLKKIELAVHRAETVWPPVVATVVQTGHENLLSSRLMEEPLDEPPRALLFA
jgi:hypothetical protein